MYLDRCVMNVVNADEANLGVVKMSSRLDQYIERCGG